MAKKTAHERYLDARADRLENGNSLALRWVIQDAMREALWEHAHARKVLPEEMAAEIAFQLLEVVDGYGADLFRHVRQRGSPGKAYPNDHCIEDAVRYMRAVQEGVIEDSQPVRTVHEAFAGMGEGETPIGLERETVEQWLAAPDFAGIESRDIRAHLLEPRMRYAGRHYARNALIAASG